MLFFPKVLLTVGVIFFLSGLTASLLVEPPDSHPPRLSERPAAASKASPPPFPAVEALAGPWVQAPPPAPPKRLAPVAPPPPPVKAPDPVDKKSLAFLGSYQDQDGSTAYFFKFLPTGSVIILKSGQSNKGWQLVDIQEHLFALSGPGGHFEVSY